MASDIEQITTMPVYQPGMDWETIMQTADEVLGFDLAKDEAADDLVGVPFVMTHVVFRRGITRDKQVQAYVSCEVRLAPSFDLRMINIRREGSELPRLSSLEGLPFGPDTHVVFNDGSTGIYRQVVQYLWRKRFITLAEPVIEGGGYGESSFDQPPGKWAGIAQGEPSETDDGFTAYAANILLLCPRGLRLSLYNNQYNPDGSKTRYLG